MHVEDIASQSSVTFEIGLQHDWKDTISGFMLIFPQVVQKH